MSKIYIILLSLLITAPLNAISQEELKTEMRFLCDSLQGGRRFASKENQSVSFYLLRHFRDNGLRATVQSFSFGDNVGHNVVAITPGYYKKYIVVGAYYDGLGTLSGKLYPGADSNASGVAALIRLSAEIQPKADIGIIYVAFDGHNAGMSGSEAFVKEYIKKYNIERVVNLDILGSGLVPINKKRPEYLIVLGGISQMFSLERINNNYNLDLAYDYYNSSAFTELFYNLISDQRYFLEAGIPAIMFTSGITDHTNKISDTLEHINFPLFTKRVNFILDWLNSIL